MTRLFASGRTIDRPTVLLALEDADLRERLERWAVEADVLPVVGVGDRAQQSAKFLQFDAVILEGGACSRELWNELDALPGTHGKPVIVIAEAFDNWRLLVGAGAFAVVERPVDLETLAAHLRHAVSQEPSPTIAERLLSDHG